MPHKVLVTGACGLVGSETVKALVANGRQVVATDLDTPANRRTAQKFGSAAVRWTDLTDRAATQALIADVAPTAIVHLAAIIPPFCYAQRALARSVNVNATADLIRIAESQPNPPRFVQASSIAVYGARNPNRFPDVLTVDTPVSPVDNYGGHKIEVEKLLTASTLEWVVLRLGGVVPAEPNLGIDKDSLYFEAILPANNRMHTVDVRDVGLAFATAVSAHFSHEVLLIGGDDTHRQHHGDLTPAFTSAMGMPGILPDKLPGDPSDDLAWFHTDWMDCERAQALLSYQQHSWPSLMAELSEKVGWKRPLFRLAAPLARRYLRGAAPPALTSSYADPWEMIRQRWGNPEPDRT